LQIVSIPMIYKLRTKPEYLSSCRYGVKQFVTAIF